ncbi:kelch repeat-containing protein [Maribacter algicola]|uniref:Kelch repeat-containing protein n=1 Tax=Meishania litoralis TaxID=3434685 RepID=A0ACC7LG67_9FLAO
MEKRKFIFLVGVLFLISCGSDDYVILDPNKGNKPPSSFELINVPDESIDVTPTPTLEWESAMDPDGDSITYDLYVDTIEEPINKVAENIAGTNFTLESTMALSPARDYYWKVVAKDGKEGETSSIVFTFRVKNLDDAKKLDAQTPFYPIENHTSVVFDQKMWVLGGFDNGEASSTPWESSDGKNWSILIVGSEERFTPRFFHAATVFEDTLWVAGGVAEGVFASDIWYSDNGGRWNKLDQNMGFTERAEHTFTSYNNMLWIIGGSNNSGKLGDVYASSDGSNWTRTVEQAAFGKRNFHQTVAFQDKLWVIGGIDENGDFKNDVWNSTDGISWNEITAHAEFSPRGFHKVLVFNDKIWVIGGGAENDIWYSEDGREWYDASPTNRFPIKSGFTTLFHRNKIWILGGSATNEVWTIDYHFFQN